MELVLNKHMVPSDRYGSSDAFKPIEFSRNCREGTAVSVSKLMSPLQVSPVSR